MVNLFGFEFRRNKPDEVAPSFVPRETDDGAVTVSAAAAYGTYVDLDGTVRTEAELVTKYREMALQPECEKAIDEVTNEAIVKEGTYEDALKYAMIKANRDNGQRYTNADKRKIIVNALDHPEYGKLNDSQLHSIFDVSRPFIAKIRLELNKPQPDVITAIRNGVEVQMRNPKLDLKKEVIDETPEPIEENTVITELSHTVQELAE